MLSQISHLLYKELLLEWKQKYALSGLLLYVACMVAIISLNFTDGIELDNKDVRINILNLSGHAWNIMYWLILLFVAINAVAKSFSAEREGQLRYLYSMAHPTAIILSKTVYNALLMIVMGVISFGLHSLFGGQNVKNPGLFLITAIAGGFAFSASLTLVSAIAAKADNKTTLLAVLAFPLMAALLLVLISVSQAAWEGQGWADVQSELVSVLGISTALTALSVLLFPFVWRE
ncbi:MAG: heme exporter protein CcmB [Bacteroidia bacterium]